MTLSTRQTLSLKCSKTLFIILIPFLNFFHVLLTLQIPLLSPHQTLKPYLLTFELLILHIVYALFHRMIVITYNHLLYFPLVLNSAGDCITCHVLV